MDSNEPPGDSRSEFRNSRTLESGPETRSQSLENFKIRKRLLGDVDGKNKDEKIEGKQLFNNHAVVYRVRQR